jgi:hypothetical protein
MLLEVLDLELKEQPYHKWGPWVNFWGYETVVAQFDDDTIIVHSLTPYDEELVAYFVDWEECEHFIMLLEQDRRF